MRQKYFIKATLKGGVSGNDRNFIYKLGINEEPNTNYSTNEPCEKGIHLARTLSDALWYVSKAKEFYLAINTGKIAGSDRQKIRTNACNILCQIPQKFVDDYRAKRKLLDDDCRAKRKPLDDDYWAKCKLLDDDYRAKRKPLDDDYWAKCKLLDKQFMKSAIKYYKTVLT